MSDPAVRAVAANQPAQFKSLFDSGRVPNHRLNRISRLRQSDQFHFTIHYGAKNRQVLSQQTLRLILRQADRETITGGQITESNVPDLTGSVVNGDSVQLMTELEHRLARSHHLKHFERARKNRQRSGSRSRHGFLVDDSASYTVSSKFAGHREADWTGT